MSEFIKKPFELATVVIPVSLLVIAIAASQLHFSFFSIREMNIKRVPGAWAHIEIPYYYLDLFASKPWEMDLEEGELGTTGDFVFVWNENRNLGITVTAMACSATVWLVAQFAFAMFFP